MPIRLYRTETDYPVLLAAAKQAGECSIAAIARALTSADIAWPPRFNDQTSRDAVEIDRDMLRAWKELGYHP